MSRSKRSQRRCFAVEIQPSGQIVDPCLPGPAAHACVQQFNDLMEQVGCSARAKVIAETTSDGRVRSRPTGGCR